MKSLHSTLLTSVNLFPTYYSHLEVDVVDGPAGLVRLGRLEGGAHRRAAIGLMYKEYLAACALSQLLQLIRSFLPERNKIVTHRINNPAKLSV